MYDTKLEVNLTDYKDTEDEVGAETERDASALLIQANRPIMEAIGAELNDEIMELSEAVSTSTEGTEINGDPSAVIANFKKEAMEAQKEHVTFKEKYNKEVRDLNKLQIRRENTSDEVTQIRREVSYRKKFYPDSAI